MASWSCASSPSVELSCCRKSVMVRSVWRSWSKGDRGVGWHWVVARWAVHCCVALARPLRTACHCGARGEAWRVDMQSCSACRSGGGSRVCVLVGEGVLEWWWWWWWWLSNGAPL
eukprot:5551140-Alexandrium_andersonii.AAC.2